MALSSPRLPRRLEKLKLEWEISQTLKPSASDTFPTCFQSPGPVSPLGCYCGKSVRTSELQRDQGIPSEDLLCLTKRMWLIIGIPDRAEAIVVPSFFPFATVGGVS